MNDSPAWIEINVVVDAAHADAVANYLIEQGSTGIAQENLRQQRVSATACIKAYFPGDRNAAAVVDSLQAYLASLAEVEGGSAAHAEITVTGIPDEDWNKKWKSFFQPINVTKRLVVKPSWTHYWKRPGEIVLELDPGMAFGTGTHPSTKLCMKAIDDYAAGKTDLGSERLLDVGTGSGILAITAALLGFGTVVGIDIDHTAIACARTNAERNGVADRLHLSTTPLQDLGGVYSVVVANILPHTLIHMKAHLLARLDTEGVLILSGILEEKASEVIAAFEPDMAFVRNLCEENWAGLVFKKR